jgi:hypothetical protein
MFSVSKTINQTLLPKVKTLLGKKHESEVLDEKLIINEDIQITEWCPDVFAYLREKDGFTNQILHESLNPEVNKDMVFKAGESQGKSGSFFFFSKDQKFIIKTMTDSDWNAFKRIMKSYFQRVSTD